jgi:hypothetical protein
LATFGAEGCAEMPDWGDRECGRGFDATREVPAERDAVTLVELAGHGWRRIAFDGGSVGGGREAGSRLAQASSDVALRKVTRGIAGTQERL